MSIEEKALRIVLLLLYIVTLIPHVAIASLHCEGDPAQHVAMAFESKCDHNSSQPCDYDSAHHNHHNCGDYDEVVQSRSELEEHAVEAVFPVQQLFDTHGLRAPPITHCETHTLPSLYGYIVVRTSRFIC